jgi:formylmethanofuran dehydrogenase subunit D
MIHLLTQQETTMTISEAIQTIEAYSNYVAFVSLGSDDYLDIHVQNGDYVTTIAIDEVDSIID